jgi:hypothetical protein
MVEPNITEPEVNTIEEDEVVRKLLGLIHQIAEDSEIVKNPPQKKSESKVDEMVRDYHYELIDGKQQLKLIEEANAIIKNCSLDECVQSSKKLGKVRNEQKSRLETRHEPDFNKILIVNSLLIPLLVCCFYGKDFAGKVEGGLTIALLSTVTSTRMYWDLRKKQKYNQKFDFLADKVQIELLKNTQKQLSNYRNCSPGLFSIDSVELPLRDRLSATIN